MTVVKIKRPQAQIEYSHEDLQRRLAAGLNELHELLERNAKRRAEAERQRSDLLIPACFSRHAREQLRAVDAALREDEREIELLNKMREALGAEVGRHGTNAFASPSALAVAGGKFLWRRIVDATRPAHERHTTTGRKEA